MAPGDLRAILKRTPFVPIRIFLSSGHSYPVTSPEWMMVTATTTAIGIPGQAGDGDQLVLLDNYQITHVEPLAISTSPVA